MRETGKGKRETLPPSPTALRRCVGALGLALAVGCGRERDMPEKVEMRDSMLDTMPGGEMARGDSAAAMKLLKGKMEPR